MSVAFYFDEHVHGAITRGLRRRGVDVFTAQDDGRGHTPDPILLDRALALGRVTVTQDVDFLREAHRRQAAGEAFAGVAYCSEDLRAIGRYVNDLELIANIDDLTDWMNQVKYLPL
jgi:Domain of unknown function (DUF5615)